MPDNTYPPGMKELMEKLRQVMMRGATPRPASGNPTMDMAIEQLKKSYPAEVNASNIKEMPWASPYANTNIMALTQTQPGPTQEVELNPVYSLLGPQKGMEQYLRHELEHVKQHLGAPPEYFNPTAIATRQAAPYDSRPTELAAIEASKAWFKKRKGTQRDMELGMDPSEVLPRSPLIKDY